MEVVIETLKWIALVFAAGLVGYFGKYLAKVIIFRFSRRKKAEMIRTVNKEELDHKLEKKKLKSEQKIEKKRRKKK